MPDTNSKTYDPKQDFHDPDKEPARNRYKDGKDFDPTFGHGSEVDKDPAPGKSSSLDSDTEGG